MLTPSKIIVGSPFQTSSPNNRTFCLKKNRSPPKAEKENHSIPSVCSPHTYQLIPDERDAKSFIWLKKELRDRKRKRDVGDPNVKKNLLDEHRQELEKVKKRRKERERKHEEQMKEREDFRKLKLAGEFENWEREEDKFMLRQAKERTKIRLQNGRGQPIDLLVQFKETGSHSFPLHVISRLTTEQLGDLSVDIKTYQEMDGETDCMFWKDALTVVEKLLHDSTSGPPRRERMNKEISSEVVNILSGKSSHQLLILKRQIQQKLQFKNSIDISFWECMIDNLEYYLAFARLEEMQKKRVESLSKQNNTSRQPDDVTVHAAFECPIGRCLDSIPEVHEHEHYHSTEVNNSPSNSFHTDKVHISEKLTKHYIQRDVDIFEEKYSPEYLKESEIDKDKIIDPEEDMEKLAQARELVRERFNRNSYKDDGTDQESDFRDEYHLRKDIILCGSKYRPRKPRYYNRIFTGFVWNRYNRTHYDIDNPPPKTVKGYRFNIFYPDLIDKTVAPTYTISPCEESNDLVVIRFRVGPPYEDVAFKIVKGNWDKSWKSGYKCNFNDKVLELWFRFKHMCYRR